MTATRKCERCGAPVDEEYVAKFLDIAVFRRNCDPCTELVWAEEEERDRLRELETRLDRAGRTRRLEVFTWAGASKADVGRGWLDDYRNGSRVNLFLDGSVGAGKTGLAWLIVRELVSSQPPVGALFVNFRDLLWDIKASFDSGSQDGSLLARRAQSATVLALDDLGAERPTAWACEQLATLIDRRYEKRVPTIVTSNYSPAQLAARMGAEDPVVGKRIVSRLTEGAQLVKFADGDRRLAA